MAFKKILIVDDEPDIRQLMRRQLNDEGYQTLEADNGRNALAMVFQHSDINVVLLDIYLPGSCGIEVYNTIRKTCPAIKIIVSSCAAYDEQKFLVIGADGYYSKDEGMESLMSKMRSLLEGTEVRR